MAGRVKAWIWVVLAIFVLGVLCIVAVAGVGLYFASKHIDTRVTSRASLGEIATHVRGLGLTPRSVERPNPADF